MCAEASARKFTGAALLDHLHNHATAVSGDPRLLRIVQRYLHAATAPYFGILSTWISTGVLKDNFAEFMIDEVAEDHAGADDHWHGHFVLRERQGSDGTESDVPALLSSVSDAVLQAGALP